MKKISFFIFTALFCCSAQAAPSSLEKRLGKNEYFIITKSSPVRAILNDFAANYSIPVFISSSVNDDFSGEIKNEKPVNCPNSIISHGIMMRISCIFIKQMKYQEV